MARLAEGVDSRFWEVLVGQQAHLRRPKLLGGDRPGSVFAGEVTGIAKAGENAVVGESGVIGEDFVLRPAGSEKFENELDGEARSPDDRFAGEDLPGPAR